MEQQSNSNAHFSGKDLFQTNQISSELDVSKSLLEKQFNSQQPIEHLDQFKTIFHQVNVYKFATFQIMLLALIACFENKKILEEITQGKGDQIEPEKISKVSAILNTFTFCQRASPIQDIKQNMNKILENIELFKWLFELVNIKVAKYLLTKYFLSKKMRMTTIQKLAINTVEKKGGNFKICALKSQEMEHTEKKKSRYFYTYLFKNSINENNKDFWLVCAEVKQKSKQPKILTLQQLQAEGYTEKKPEGEQKISNLQKENQAQPAILEQNSSSSQNNERSNSCYSKQKQNSFDNLLIIFLFIYIVILLFMNLFSEKFNSNFKSQFRSLTIELVGQFIQKS